MVLMKIIVAIVIKIKHKGTVELQIYKKRIKTYIVEFCHLSAFDGLNLGETFVVKHSIILTIQTEV